MSAQSLRVARLNSIAVLIIGYVALTFVWGHQQRLNLLGEARMAVARLVLADSEESRFIPGLGKIEVEYEAEEEGPEEDRQINRFIVVASSGSRWAVKPYTYKSSFFSAGRLVDVNLDEIAGRLGIFAEPDQEYVVLYQEVSNKIIGATVSVPGTGLGFQGTQVMWVCTLLSLGLMIVIRDRVQHVLKDPELATEERWLLVDGVEGIEKVVAQIWRLGLLVVPSLVASGLILAITLQTTADGAISGWFRDTVVATTLIGLVVVNAWLSLSAVSCILRLGILRNPAVAETATPPETDKGLSGQGQ